MSEQDEISRIVKELNNHKNDVLITMKTLIEEGEKLVKQATKEQKVETMAKLIINAKEKYTKVKESDIPLLKAPGVTVVSNNTLTLVSPIAKNSPYKSIPIPIQFTATGPDHSATTGYNYYVIILDNKDINKPKRVFDDKGIAKSKDVTLSKSINLPDGKYTIQITTATNTVKNKAIMKSEETFVIATGKTSTVLSNVTIISPTKNGVYTQPIDIQFKVDGMYHDIITPAKEAKEYMYQIFILNGKNELVIPAPITNKTKDKEVLLKGMINNLTDGKYDIVIITGDSNGLISDNSNPAKVTFEIKTGAGPTPSPVTSEYTVDVIPNNTTLGEVKSDSNNKPLIAYELSKKANISQKLSFMIKNNVLANGYSYVYKFRTWYFNSQTNRREIMSDTMLAEWDFYAYGSKTLKDKFDDFKNMRLSSKRPYPITSSKGSSKNSKGVFIHFTTPKNIDANVKMLYIGVQVNILSPKSKGYEPVTNNYGYYMIILKD